MTTRPTGPDLLTLEEIPTIQRPAAAARYLQLLDEGVLPENIRFANYGGTLRVEATNPDGTPGVSRAVPPAHELLASDAATTASKPDDEQVHQRRSLLAELVGNRVRLRWPGGHERVGLLERHERFGYCVTPDCAVLLHSAHTKPLIEALT